MLLAHAIGGGVLAAPPAAEPALPALEAPVLLAEPPLLLAELPAPPVPVVSALPPLLVSLAPLFCAAKEETLWASARGAVAVSDIA